MPQLIDIDIILTGIADEAFPIWLSFELIDRHGFVHVFEEKAPVIFWQNDPMAESYPQTITLQCKLIKTFEDYALISMEEPYNIISGKNESRFEIPLSAVRKRPLINS